jgi:hypothetical protein
MVIRDLKCILSFVRKNVLCRINFICEQSGIWFHFEQFFVGGAVYSPAITDFTFMVKVYSAHVSLI